MRASSPTTNGPNAVLARSARHVNKDGLAHFDDAPRPGRARKKERPSRGGRAPRRARALTQRTASEKKAG
eukprot:6406364-Pyramimonas_sp.AAC.1